MFNNSIGITTNVVLCPIQVTRQSDNLINKYNQLHYHKVYLVKDLDKSDVDYRNFPSMMLNIKIEQYGLFPMIHQYLYSSTEFPFIFQKKLL